MGPMHPLRCSVTDMGPMHPLRCCVGLKQQQHTYYMVVFTDPMCFNAMLPIQVSREQERDA